MYAQAYEVKWNTGKNPLGFVFYVKLRFELKYRTKPNKNEGSDFSLFVEL